VIITIKEREPSKQREQDASLSTGERRDRFDFAALVPPAHFSGDGKRLPDLTTK
jgi:hypothetical protein